MSFKDYIVFGVLCWLTANAAVHDELPQCGLTGVYRTRQSVLQSPHYPDNYPVNTCWDYVIRSPYRCPTKFHIQFLDFYLESSPNCTNDYLAIGLENDGDDMDVLCGQVIGIRKYHTPDGVLRLRFLSDDSPWSTGKGFKLLVTRLACEREDLSRELSVEDVDEDTVQVNAPTPPKQLQPPNAQTPQLFRNFSLQDQHRPFALPPLFGYPNQLQYQVPNQLPNHFGSQLPNQLPNQFGSQLPNQLPNHFGSQLPNQLPNQFQNQLPNQFQNQLPNQFQNQLPHQLSNQYPVVPHTPSTDLGGYYLPLGVNPTFAGQSVPGRPPILGINGQNQPNQPCPNDQTSTQQPTTDPQQQQRPVQQQQLPAISDQYLSTAFQPQPPMLKDYDPQNLQQLGSQAELCCASSFTQQHFYLSSPGFPRTVFTALLPTQHRDCVFYLEKNTPSVCRLRVQFKFFDFGHNNQIGEQLGQTNYPQLNALNSCSEDYVEIDGQRFCGCRSGYVHKSYWAAGKKAIRLRMGYGGVPSNGFLLEIHQEQDQEGCRDVMHTVNADAGKFGGGLQTNSLGAYGLQQTNGLYGINFAAPQQQQQQHQQFQQPQQVPLLQQPLYPTSGGHVGFLPQTSTGYQHVLPTHPWQAAYQPAYPLGALQLPQYRNARRIEYARGINTQQPVTVVETNSTRKEFYYYDGDEAFARASTAGSIAENRADTDANVEPDEPDEQNADQQLSTKAFEQSSCSFDYMEVLKLTVDTLWLTKPICFAPLRSWFGNIFG